MYMSRMIIANMSKATLKIKRYGIMGKKNAMKATKPAISLTVSNVIILKIMNIIREPSNRGDTGVLVGIDEVSVLCVSRTSF